MSETRCVDTGLSNAPRSSSSLVFPLVGKGPSERLCDPRSHVGGGDVSPVVHAGRRGATHWGAQPVLPPDIRSGAPVG